MVLYIKHIIKIFKNYCRFGCAKLNMFNQTICYKATLTTYHIVCILQHCMLLYRVAVIMWLNKLLVTNTCCPYKANHVIPLIKYELVSDGVV